jgi:hypothetical protein
VLGLLPLGLLAIDPTWFSSALFLDPYIYFGYYLDLPGHLRAFPDHYISTRLPVLLPGWLAHRLLPTAAANAALHLSLYYLALGLGHRLLAAAAGARAALLACLVLGCNPFFLSAVGTDYTDGYAIVFLLAGLACAQSAAAGPRPRAGWLVGAGRPWRRSCSRTCSSPSSRGWSASTSWPGRLGPGPTRGAGRWRGWQPGPGWSPAA